MEKTFSMIKPEALFRGVSGKIITKIEESGLKIIAQKMLWLSADEAARFYAGPIIVQVLAGENAVENYRHLMGSPNPAAAEDGTLRRLYGVSIEKNAVHGSDCLETAEREIAFFFNQLELMK